MADAFTTFFNLTKPEPGASDDTWGDKLNSNFDIIDDALNDIAVELAGISGASVYVGASPPVGAPANSLWWSPGKFLAIYFNDGDSTQWVEIFGAVASGGGSSTLTFNGCRLERTGTQSIPNNTLTTLQWTDEKGDTGNYFDSAVNNERIYITVDGWYMFTASIDFSSNTGGTRRLVFLNSTGKRYSGDQRPANSNGPVAELSITLGPIYMTAGMWMSVQALQASGGALNSNSQAQNSFTVEFRGV